MIECLTMLKETPTTPAGFTLYVRGTLVKSTERESDWREPIGSREVEVLDNRCRPEWVKVETCLLLVDDRPTLAELLKEQLYTVFEMLEALGWTYVRAGEHYAKDIQCCGENVSIGGFLGPEHGECRKCGKSFDDMTGVLPAGRNTVGMIDINKYKVEDGRVFAIHIPPITAPSKSEVEA